MEELSSDQLDVQEHFISGLLDTADGGILHHFSGLRKLEFAPALGIMLMMIPTKSAQLCLILRHPIENVERCDASCVMQHFLHHALEAYAAISGVL